MAKVSVIIPYFRGAAYLQDCVASIVAQQLADYEIIIVRDQDGAEIPESVLASEAIAVYEAPDNLPEGEKDSEGAPFGVAICRNIGLEKATGDYIYFIDCDDYLLDQALTRLLEVAEEKQAVAVTGNKVSTWFKPSNYDPEKAIQESFIDGVQPLVGDVLKERFHERYSVQHLLIKRDFLQEKGIVCDTDTRYYSDVRFCVEVLQKARENMWVAGDSMYAWRHHNDPIHLPALSQEKDERRSAELLGTYDKVMKLLSDKDADIRYNMDQFVIRYFHGEYLNGMHQELVYSFREIMQKMPEWDKILADYTKAERRALSLIRKGKYAGALRLFQIARWKKKGNAILRSRIHWYQKLEKYFFNKMSIRRDWVLIESFFGKSYSDSPKYLYEYLQKTRGDKYRYIWVLNDMSPALAKTGKHTRVKMNSLRYVYYASRCGYRIFNVRQPAWNTKRPGVVFLETWHGTPLKKLAFDIEDLISASQNHKTMFYKHSREWDYLISANRFSTDVFERAFVYDREKILEYGYPRNDILYAENREEIASEVKEEIGIPEGKRVILYAPTWRDNQIYAQGKYKFTLALDLGRLQKEFGDNSVVLLRTHYYIADLLDLAEYEGFVYNGSQYEDVSRLYLASDICITDYSSVFFDYANLKRPILFFAYDYDEYADEIRGMYMDMDRELPGPLLRTNDAVVEALHNIDAIIKTYQTRYEEFYERFCDLDDGHASERVIEKVFGEREIKRSNEGKNT